MKPERFAERRIVPLDGLRGVAALVVVFDHIILASVPPLANAYLHGGRPFPQTGSLAWALLYTPLHLVWAGKEFVCVFFVLSGYVLALPMARGGRFRAAAYYPRRFARLYLPVWGALCVAALLFVVVSHIHVPAATWWLNEHAAPPTLLDTFRDVVLVFGAANWAYTSVLWSLSFEIVFSILLPAFVFVAAATRRIPFWAAAMTFAIIFVGNQNSLAHYMPVFMLGSLIAFQQGRLTVARQTLRANTLRNRSIKAFLILACVVCLTSDWWFRSNLWFGSGIASSAAEDVVACTVALGACIALVLPLLVGTVEQLLTTTPVRWAGVRSFSLYLVHEPVVVAVAFALGGHPGVALLTAIALPAALALAEFFYRVIELPAILFSRHLGQRFGGATRNATEMAEG
jgi:peptidoglycan/LPS O-acetylase OafA/YrhL